MIRLFLVFCLTAAATGSRAQLRINEISNGPGGSKEYVEFVAVGTRSCTDSTLDIRGIIFDDNPGWYHNAGTGAGCFRFANVGAWSGVPYGSRIVVYNAADPNALMPADDPADANNDGVYVVPSSSGLLEVSAQPAANSTSFNYNAATGWAAPTAASWGNSISLGNTQETLHIIVPSVSTTVAAHSVSYGPLTGGVQTPQIAFPATAGGATAFFNSGSAPASQASWTSGGAPAGETPGAGNGPANTAWIASMTAPIVRLYVDGSVTTSGNGASWGTAKKRLEEALLIANTGTCVSEIWVAGGTYVPTTNSGFFARDSSFRILRNGIKVYGGFAGNETALSQRNILANPAILSGDIGTPNDSADNVFHVVTFVAGTGVSLDTTTVLDGFTIQRGNADSPSSFSVSGRSMSRQDGGGIYLVGGGASSKASPRIINCTFRNHFARYGGGIYCNGTGAGSESSPRIRNCVFMNNRASLWGGAILNNAANGGISSPPMSEDTFTTNQAGSSGGAVYNHGNGAGSVSSPALQSCVFTGNKSAGSGGAMVSVGGGTTGTGSPLISQCSFTANEAVNSGGALYYTTNGGVANPLIDACTFSGNSIPIGANAFGGAIYVNGIGGQTPMISNSTFAANRGEFGGAVYMQTADPAVFSNTIFSGNRGGNNGGALRFASTSPIISGCSFSDNNADFGASVAAFLTSVVSLNSCAFSTDTAFAGGSINVFAGGNFNASNCRFTQNYASGAGGAIQGDGTASSLRNCVFSSNSAPTAGAVHIAGGTMSIINGVLANNTAGASGGGALVVDGKTSVVNTTFSSNSTTSTTSAASGTIRIAAGDTLNLSNCIIWGAAAQQVANSGTAIFSFSDVKGVIPTATNLNIDPNFINASDPDGADNTWGTTDDGLRLDTCSAALNAGSNALLPAGITQDYSGTARIQLGVVDMGAYEHSYGFGGLPDVTIAAATLPACQGALVTFSATSSNAGIPSYQWFRNSSTVQTGAGTSYASSSLQNNDTVWVVLTNTGCGYTDTSNRIVVTIIPAQLHVDSSVAVSGTGLSWASPLKTVDEALDIANASTTCPATILVKKGTYFPMTDATTAAASRDSSLRILRNGIKVFGGFGGTDTTMATRNPTLYPTVLSGDIGTLNDSTDNSYHVLTITSPAGVNLDSNTRLDGFTVTRGNATGSGVFAVSGTAVIRSDGGGLQIIADGAGDSVGVTVDNCIFIRNNASVGGGIYCAGYNSGVNRTYLRNTTITQNTAVDVAGVHSRAGTGAANSTSIERCVITDNRAIGSAGGAGLFVTGGATGVVDALSSVISNNSCSSNGGGFNVYTSAGSLTLTNCMMSGNITTAAGGGGGGAIHIAGGSTATFNNSTFSNNSTASAAAATSNAIRAVGTTILNNTIVWGDSAQQVAGTITYNSSDVRGITPPVGSLSIDPVFINASDPDGADNIWRTSDDGLRVDTCSPVLNAGNNAYVAGLANDITGTTARILNSTVDMGAYEHTYSFGGFPVVTIAATPQPACAGVPITFTATPQNVSPATAVYQWYRNSTMVQTGAGATFTSSTLAANDTVWVILTNTDCGYLDTSNRIVVTIGSIVTPSVSISVAPNDTVCAGTNVVFTATPANGGASPGWQWIRNGVPVGSPAPTYATTTLTSGTTVQVRMISAAGCTTTDTVFSNIVTMTILAAPAVPAAVNGNATPCIGAIETYSIPPVQAATFYTWSTPGAGWGGTSATPSLSATVGSASGNVSVTATNSCGTSAAAVLPVTPITTPSAPGGITGNPAPCAGSSQTYGVANVPGATTYTWTLPMGWATAGSATSSITTTPNSTAGNITVTASNVCGTSGVSTLAVAPSGIAGAPSSITGDTSVCAGTLHTYTIAAVPGATTYNWTTPAGWTGSSLSNSLTTTASGTGGNVSVTVTNTCGVSAPAVLAVSVSSVPLQPGTISGNVAPCVGTLQAYAIASMPGATGYTWTTPGAGWAGTSNTTTLNATAGSTSGNITVTANNLCGSSTPRTFAVAPNSIPAQPLVINGSAQPCIGVATTYGIAAVANAASYTWTVPVGWSGGVSSTTFVTATPTAAAGAVTVTANNVCGSSTAATLGVTPITSPAQPGTMSFPAQICSGAAGTYFVPAVLSASSYTWTLPVGWMGSSSSNTIIATPGMTGGTITVTATNSCGTSPARTAAVVVTPLPGTPTGISGPSPVCAGSTQVYSSAGSNAATAYVWTLPAGWAGTSTTTSISALVGSTGGTITVRGQNVCGQSSPVSVPVTVNPLTPVTANITATGPTTVCPGVAVTIIAAVTGGGTAPGFVWTRNGTIQGGVSGTTLVVSSPVSGDVIGFQMTSSAVCPSPPVVLAQPITITVLPPVVPGININTQFSTAPIVCAATQLNFTANIIGGGIAPVYQWRRNGIVVGTNAPTYSAISWTNGETVQAALTSTAPCATPATVNSNLVTVTVTPNVAPAINISASPGTTFIPGQPVTFTATVVGAGPSPQFQWMRNGQNIQGGFLNPYTTTLLTGGDTITAKLTSSDPCASPTTAQSNALVMTKSTSIGHLAGSNSPGLYPNPNDGRFTVLLDGARAGLRTSIQVLNTLGQVVWTREVIIEKQNLSIQVELADIAAGVYLLRLTAEDGTHYTQRFEMRQES